MLRKLSYYLLVSGKVTVNVPVAILFYFIYRKRKQKCSGVAIFDLADMRSISLRSEVEKALALIRNVDPRRYNRVKKEIRTIINSNFRAKLNYAHVAKRCQVNLSRFYHIGKPSLLPEELACALIQMATIGYFESRFFAYHGTNRRRIAKQAIKETLRFARKLPITEYQWEEHFSKKLGDLDRTHQI